MTKTILMSLVVASAIFSGCSTKTVTTAEKEKADFSCKQDGISAPEWTCNPTVEGGIAALGIASMNAGNDKAFQRSEAMATGRDVLASQISVKVSNLFKSYKGTTGTGADATFDAASSKVSKQLASETLAGSKSVASWVNPKTKELYLLVTVGNDTVKKGMDEAVKTSFQNDAAMYQKFLAEKANGELDAELSKAAK